MFHSCAVVGCTLLVLSCSSSHAQYRPVRERPGADREQTGIGYWPKERVHKWLDDGCDMLASRFIADYQLTPAEAEKARAKMDDVRRKAHEYWEKNGDEIQSLFQEMDKYVARIRTDKEAKEIWTTLFNVRQKFLVEMPAHHRLARPEVEKAIPPEKVKAYHDRAALAVAESRQLHETLVGSREADQSSLAIVRNSMPWAWYVELFIRIYRLDDKQQKSAWSMLRELDAQREAIVKNGRQAVVSTAPAGRPKAMAAIDAKTVPLFEELRQRLDTIPTHEQRLDAERRGVRTKPATRPATTRQS